MFFYLFLAGEIFPSSSIAMSLAEDKVSKTESTAVSVPLLNPARYEKYVQAEIKPVKMIIHSMLICYPLDIAFLFVVL